MDSQQVGETRMPKTIIRQKPYSVFVCLNAQAIDLLSTRIAAEIASVEEYFFI